MQFSRVQRNPVHNPLPQFAPSLMHAWNGFHSQPVAIFIDTRSSYTYYVKTPNTQANRQVVVGPQRDRCLYHIIFSFKKINKTFLHRYMDYSYTILESSDKSPNSSGPCLSLYLTLGVFKVLLGGNRGKWATDLLEIYAKMSKVSIYHRIHS